MDTPAVASVRGLAGRRVTLPGHFVGAVTVEGARLLGSGAELRVRLPTGELDEAVLSREDLARLLEAEPPVIAARAATDPEKLRLLVESARIRLAYAYDHQFAVSLSGIRTLPHQIEAVYQRMLPQPRLRFLLADDPGAGKTIMAGLLVKELKFREAIDRCLILVPAPLTIQWQDELLRFFGEPFQVIHSANDQQQLLNLWEREAQVISSIDYAKQDDVRERVWRQRWDLVIIDEAHKCSAYTRRSASRGDEIERTKRYQLAERLSEHCDNLLLLTATPHHGDDDRFAHFIRLLDRDLFPEPHRAGEDAGRIRRDILRLGADCPWSLRRLKEDLKDMHGRRLFPNRRVGTVSFRLGREEEDVVVAHERAQGRECERVGRLKIGFDVRSLAPPDPQTGYRDPVAGVRRIEVKGRRRGQGVRLTTNEWYKAQQLGDTYWLYVVWDPLDDPDPVPLMVQNPAKCLDHAKKEVVAARYYDLPAGAVERAARDEREKPG